MSNRRTTTYASPARIILTAAALAIGAPTALAQGSSSVYLEGSGVSSAYLGNCQRQGVAGSPVYMAPGADCSVFGPVSGPFYAAASAQFGVLRAEAHVGPVVPDEQLLRYAHATATWSDRAQVGGALAALADRIAITLAFDGHMTTGVEATGQAPSMQSVAQTNVWFQSRAINDTGYRLISASFPYYDASGLNPGCPVGGAACTRSQSVSQSYTAYVRPGESFFAMLDVHASIQILGGPGSPATEFSRLFARNDFAHTLQFISYAVLDAAGQDITAQTDVTFEQGTQFGPSATVPEPGTWALLGTGLLALGGIARRRPRAA